jgi:antibiotic biosynthesis monooxygenase (ABM) superfamily enzyme
MRKLLTKNAAICLGASVLFLGGCSLGRETASQKTLMHVFAYTPLENSTPEDFDRFQKATYDLVGKVPGLRRVWVGKLREPVAAENDRIRTYGVAMEFDNVQALDAYAQHPAHKQWIQFYDKVRAPGTTTLDIMP